MSHDVLLKDSIELLNCILEELHDDIDSSKRRQLIELIAKLESCREKEAEISNTRLLTILAKAVALFPAIERIFKQLSDL